MYVKQSFNVLFYRKMKKKNQNGEVPIYVRLTIDGLKDEMSTSIWINPDHWEQSLQVVTTGNENFEKQWFGKDEIEVI